MLKKLLIAYIVLAAAALLAYLPKLIQFRYAFRKPPHRKAAQKRKLSLVVAARNESATIPPLLQSIEKQTYPKDRFTLNVIVKDEADPTVGLVKKLGGNVFVVPEQACKGDALDGYFKAIGADASLYDAFVIVDADAVLSERYLEELNNALEFDADIFISRKFNRNLCGGRATRTLFSNCAALLWPILDDLGNRWRYEHDVPLNLCGQGMMVRRRVIGELGGWPFRTLTEDYELGSYSLLKGYKSMYYPNAALFTEEALRHRENYNRKLRWITGYAQCDKLYRSRIRKQAKSRGKFSLGEFHFLFGYYPVILFALATVYAEIAGLVLGSLYFVQGNPLWRQAYLYLIGVPFGVLYLLLFLYGLLAYFSCRRMFDPLLTREKAAMLLYNPFYLLEFCPIYIKAQILVRKNKSPAWAETERVDYHEPQA